MASHFRSLAFRFLTPPRPSIWLGAISTRRCAASRQSYRSIGFHPADNSAGRTGNSSIGIPDGERNMAVLVAEENVRPQDAEIRSLFDSSEKECIVGHDAPAFQGIHCPLVRGERCGRSRWRSGSPAQRICPASAS